MSTLLPIGEAARRLKLSVDTVRELARTGRLRASRTPGGHRRFSIATVDAYLTRRTSSAEAHADEYSVSAITDNLDETDPREESVARRMIPTPPAGGAALAESFVLAANHQVERARLDGLKAHGRVRIPFSASARARSAVIEMLEGYVTVARFPASMPWWESRPAIEAKVAAVLEPFTAEAARPPEPSPTVATSNADHTPNDRLVQALIAHGKSRALFATIGWDRDEAEDARGDVLEALEDEVEAEWTERDVSELVDEILGEWEEESDE